MSDELKSPSGIGVRQLFIWAIPLGLGLAGLLLVILIGWELWTGIGLAIAGALGTLMLVGQHYKIGPDS
ncbi:hypothetical protein GCM10007420_26500 [Glycocaulis albus]|jgi:hypothetical protein|uniref:Uncharacterized protein n=1 Tax=Glycocaulis albus TaxID=1382801 RepID=A0ABQ1Y0X8_9PROT|nr:hypothetical protein [Glycocaulis albus]MBV5258262.1 hypothetical protein [Synechococcus moorigangaii CMS01]GGH08344.1 hypothetical protein GCM10007420_26500 [Glycocaulis albus]